MGVFGQRLVELRKAAGLTQADLAKQSKISEAFISAVETGRKRPSILTVEALANGLPADAKELLDLLRQDTVDAAAARKRALKPVAFVPLANGLLAEVPAEVGALAMALTHEPALCTVVVELHQTLQALSQPRQEALLHLLAAVLAAFAPESA